MINMFSVVVFMLTCISVVYTVKLIINIIRIFILKCEIELMSVNEFLMIFIAILIALLLIIIFGN
jgi:hypothetical protein